MVPGPLVTSQETEPILAPFSKAVITSIVWTLLIAPPCGLSTSPTAVTVVEGTVPVLLGSSGTEVTLNKWTGGATNSAATPTKPLLSAMRGSSACGRPTHVVTEEGTRPRERRR